jgi:hypothetical protein
VFMDATSTTPKQNPPSTQKYRFWGSCPSVCALTRAFQWALVRPIQISTKFLSEIFLIQVGSQSIHLVFEPSETAEKRLYLNIYSCIWRGRWFCSSGRTHTTAASFGQCRHLDPAVSQLFSAILGVFGGGTAILGVFCGATAQKRLDANVHLCRQVVLSFRLQLPAPLHHRVAVSQPIPSPKCKFSSVKHGKFCPCSRHICSLFVGRSKNSSKKLELFSPKTRTRFPAVTCPVRFEAHRS